MQGERTFAELTHDLASQAGELVRNEVRLARAETVESVKQLSNGLAGLAAGAALGIAACVLALLALTWVLALALPMWVSALIAAACGAAGAYSAFRAGLRAMSTDRLALSKTAAQVQRDLQMIKENVG